MSRRGSNIYKRADGRYEGHIKIGYSEWLESKRLTVKQSTYANYSRLLKNHIYPLLVGQAYSLLSKKQLNSFISELVSDGRKDGKGGLSSKTVKDIFIILKSV